MTMRTHVHVSLSVLLAASSLASAVDFVALKARTHARGFLDGRVSTFRSSIDLGVPTDVVVATSGTSVLVLAGRDLYELGVSSGGASVVRTFSGTAAPSAMCVGPMGVRLLTADGVIDASEQVLLPKSALPLGPVALAEGLVNGESYLVVAGVAELAGYQLAAGGYAPLSSHALPAPARDVAFAGWAIPMVIVAADVTRGYFLPYFEEASLPAIADPIAVDWSCEHGSGNCPVIARDAGDVLRTIDAGRVVRVVGQYPGLGTMASTTGMGLEAHTVVANDGAYMDLPAVMAFGRSSSGGGYQPLHPPTLTGIAGEGNRVDSGDFLGVDAEGMAGDGVVDFVVASYSREGRSTANPMVTAYEYDPTLPSGSRWVKRGGSLTATSGSGPR
jgi:hypothetical protein